MSCNCALAAVAAISRHRDRSRAGVGGTADADGSGPQASGQLHAWSGEQASGRFAHLSGCGANEFLFIDGGSWRTIDDKDELSKPYRATESLLHKGRMSLGRRPLSIQKLASRTTIASALRR